MTEQEWNTSADPIALLRHLAANGCSEDFLRFENELLGRIRPEITEATLLQVIQPGAVGLDEALDDARRRLAELSSQAASMKICDPRAQAIHRQLQIADALLIYEGQGFAETVMELAIRIAKLSDDVVAERRWQCETIRLLYSYQSVSPDE